MAENRETTPHEVQLLRQQAALAEFGGFALCSTDLNEVLQRACDLVSEGVRVRLVKVLEALPDGGGLLLRAGVGWKEGVVGHTILPPGMKSAPGYALQTDEAVISHDLAQETRFQISDLLREHGAVSVVNVIIRMPEGPPFGVLEVDSTQPRGFDQSDVDFLESYANLIGAAVHRLRRDEELRASMVEREVLMRELQHRVKNNLQVISGLITLEGARTSHPEATAALQSLRHRLEALRLLHDRLYATQRVTRIDLRSYLGELCGNLIDFHGEQASNVRIVTSLPSLLVHVDVAVPLGLIVNEFITNSVKHAFDGRPGTIMVEAEPPEDDRARLVLRDSGKGMQPPSRRVGTRTASGSGSGKGLIEALVRQIDGTATWKSDGGTELRIEFRYGGDRRDEAERL